MAITASIAAKEPLYRVDDLVVSRDRKMTIRILSVEGLQYHYKIVKARETGIDLNRVRVCYRGDIENAKWLLVSQGALSPRPRKRAIEL